MTGFAAAPTEGNPVSGNPRLANVLAAFLNLTQWFQFGLSGYLAHELTTLYSPWRSNPWWSPYALFAVAYLARPIGGIVFGSIADRSGRRVGLLAPTVLMSACSVLLGTLHGPSLSNAVVLLACRFSQGLAIGGEYPAAVVYFVERSNQRDRGKATSLAPAGALLGIAFALITSALIKSDTRYIRNIFILSGLLGTAMSVPTWTSPVPPPEPAHFIDDRSTSNGSFVGRVLLGMTVYFASAVIFAMNFLFMPLFAQEQGRFPALTATTFNMIEATLLSSVALSLPFVASSFSAQRRFRLYQYAVFAGGATAPFLYLGTLHGTTLVALGSIVTLATLNAGSLASAPELIGTMFERRRRAKGVALVYGLSQASVGGTAPLVGRWLIAKTGSDASPGVYVLFFSIVSVLAMMLFGNRLYRADIEQ
jgi:MHS family proline/betaine transporter-like MFS transporter